jgi:GNAT superfamily N-acetyltransferase
MYLLRSISLKIYELHEVQATMPLTIRQARPADAPLIVEFNRRMALETEHKVLDQVILERGVAQALADPHKGQYFLAEDGGEVLGQTLLTAEWSDWRNGWFWWIQSVYVRPEARRRGVFRALYEHIVEQARQTPDVIGIRLYVERDNRRAQQTYQQLGMELTGYLLLEMCPL